MLDHKGPQTRAQATYSHTDIQRTMKNELNNNSHRLICKANLMRTLLDESSLFRIVFN